jgi:hypothetical protein
VTCGAAVLLDELRTHFPAVGLPRCLAQAKEVGHQLTHLVLGMLSSTAMLLRPLRL